MSPVLARSRHVETSRASPISEHKRTSHERRDRIDLTKILIAVCAILVSLIGGADAEQCPPGALGVSRTLVVDPTEHPRVGSMQYPETLPLDDHEVVLTFDDGPIPRYTTPILETLASECVKATFFMVGQMARAYPWMVRRVYDEGHTIANHTQNHPIRKMSVDQAAREIEGGFESLRNAIGDSQAVSPFFRNPGLLRQKSVEQYLDAHGDMTWSADFLADDWTRINNSEVARRAISRIEARGRGILLLHDIHARTVLALPEILNELKSRGYKIVHVVPAAADRPKTATSAEQWVARPTPEQHTSPSQMRPLRRPPKRGLRTLHDVRFEG
jgi:peptidoglycan/xylan/chitin deacetylase (PgdA/CDA1 family)